MESIQKIILISGVPSSGKTHLSRLMADCMKIPKENIVECDYIYFAIAKELGVDKTSFPNFKVWRETDLAHLNNLRRKYYREFLEKRNEKTIIIEGFNLANRDDRNIIKEILPNIETKFVYKKVCYYQWLEQKNKSCMKLDIDRTKAEYEDLVNFMQIPKNEEMEVIIV